MPASPAGGTTKKGLLEGKVEVATVAYDLCTGMFPLRLTVLTGDYSTPPPPPYVIPTKDC